MAHASTTANRFMRLSCPPGFCLDDERPAHRLMAVAAFFRAEDFEGPGRRRHEIDGDRLAATRHQLVHFELLDLHAVNAVLGFDDQSDSLSLLDFYPGRLEGKALRGHFDHARRGSRDGVLWG